LEKRYSFYSGSWDFANFIRLLRIKRLRSCFGVGFTRLFSSMVLRRPQEQIKRVLSALFYVRMWNLNEKVTGGYTTHEKPHASRGYTTSQDSTYLVFVFTYICPHCLNSIENLKQYEPAGIVDKVIGIALENSVAEKQFREVFKPEFQIKNYSSTILFHLTNTFPQTYYIKNDSIILVLSGELPCSYVFMQILR